MEDSTSRGRLTDAERRRLYDAVEETKLGSLVEPATACAADNDGTSVSYSWTSDGQHHEVDSCEVRISTEDPLVQALDELAARLEG